MPAPVLDALNKEIKVFLEREDIKDQMAKIGARTDYGHAAAIFRLPPGGDGEVRRHHQAEGLQMDAG